MEILLGGMKFETKEKALEYFRIFLKSHSVGYVLNDTQKEWFKLVMSSSEHGRKKIGCGVEKVFIEMNAARNKAFSFYRVDGSKDDISFLKLVPTSDKKHSQHERDVIKALRNLVRPHKSVSGNHAHHTEDNNGETFLKIYREFLNEYSLDPEKIELEKYKTHESNQIKDFKLKDAFIKFHSEKAVLCEVSPEEHRKIHSIKKSTVKLTKPQQ